MENIINKLRNELQSIEASAEKDFSKFTLLLKDVPPHYYDSLFFPTTAGKENVVVNELRLIQNKLFYTIRPLRNEFERNNTGELGDYPAFSLEVARNLLSAIEVAFHKEKETALENEKIERNRLAIEESQNRR